LEAIAGTATANRARQACVAVFMQIIVAVVYSWSVLRGPLAELHGWSKAQTIMPYRYALVVIAIGSVIGGRWQDRYGPRMVATAGGLLVGIGFLISAFFGDTLAGLVIGYGVVAGIGGGFAYVTPIANLVKWFPDKRGSMVGLAVMGSGISPLFWGPLVESIVGHDPTRLNETVPRAFIAMALIFAAGVIGAAQFYRDPPAGWKPEGWNPPDRTHHKQWSAWEMLTTWQFYSLWMIFFLGSSVGLTAIGQASPLFREFAGAAPISAGVAVGVMGLFNGAGRLGWGTFSDHAGRKMTLLMMSGAGIVACLVFLRTVNGFWDLMIGLSLAALSYGGFLALMPALSADYFGESNVGGNYGLLFLAWGLCGFVVPGYFESILDRARVAGNLAAGYNQVYLALAGLALAVAVLAALLRPPVRFNR
jgi:OFA family oxalate/formate antiporter-like MFS transporter